MGGGFPENFAKALSQNKSMINSIKIAIDNGLPTYAEGGGLMYLMKVIQDLKGKEYPMVGVFQGKAVMTDRLQNFGYVSAMTSQDTIIAPKDTILHGHEFHRSKIVDSTDSTSFFVKKEESKSIWECGYTYKNCLGTYVHIDFYAYPDLIDNFLKKCLVYGKENNNE